MQIDAFKGTAEPMLLHFPALGEDSRGFCSSLYVWMLLKHHALTCGAGMGGVSSLTANGSHWFLSDVGVDCIGYQWLQEHILDGR